MLPFTSNLQVRMNILFLRLRPSMVFILFAFADTSLYQFITERDLALGDEPSAIRFRSLN